MEVTKSELIEALLRARQAAESGARPAGAMTTQELIAELNVSENKVRTLLKKLDADGQLGVAWVRSRRIDGVVVSIPAYYLVLPNGQK